MQSKRRVLVTGGAKRIGRALCEALAADGWDVGIHCWLSLEEASALALELQQRFAVESWVLQADLGSVAACEGLMAEFVELAGGCELLVNNASVFERKKLLKTSAHDFELQWRVNVLAPMILTRDFASYVAGLNIAIAGDEAGAKIGQVVNLLDRRIATHEAGCLSYLVSKQALCEFTLSSAIELAPNIAVNAIAPGAVLAPPVGTVSELAGVAPLTESPTVADLGRSLIYLANSHAVTGQVLYVDAGQHLL